MQRGSSFWRKLYFELSTEVEQVLGKALYYPYYSEDQKNFPGSTKEDGVCVGDHVPESLLDAASKFIEDRATAAEKRLQEIVVLQTKNKELQDEVKRLNEANRKLTYFYDSMIPAAFGTLHHDGWQSDIIYKPIAPLKINESDNTPCTQENNMKSSDGESLGHKINRLKAYFEKHSRENNKRAEAKENSKRELLPNEVHVRNDRSAYYHTGKADAYKNAAEKVTEILGE